MSGDFLERNKKKGLLASLLLFARGRKLTAFLLFLVLVATTVFLGPSSWLPAFPRGKRSYGDLVAAFQAARAKSRAGGAGWGAFFGRAAVPAGVVPNSLDFVKGDESYLRRGTGTVAGIVDPADAGGGRVPLSADDVGGPSAGGADASDALARAALAELPAAPPTSGAKAGRARGRLSARASRELEARAMQGASGAGALDGNRPYSQLADAGSLGRSATACCRPPGCTGESAAANTGAVYDGSAPAGADSCADGATVGVPPAESDAAAGDSQKTAACAELVQQCAQSRAAPLQRELADALQLQAWSAQLGAACGNPCRCGPCSDLKAKIDGLCSGDLAAQTGPVSAPCPALPDYCAALGFTLPATGSSGTVPDGCRPSAASCGCAGLLCRLECSFGS